MFIKRFLLVSCIASGLVFGIWWLSYRKVFYLFKDFEEVEGYWLNSYEWDNFEESIGDESTDEASELEIDNVEVEREECIDANFGDEDSNLLEDKEIKNEDEILFELVIPSINLRKSVYNMDSSLNNVDWNVEILENSNMSKKLFYLVSHSGGGEASYFDSLVYLEVGDIIWLYGDEESYGFVVKNMFYINKNGYFEASYGSDGNVLFLITCSVEYVGKQLIVEADLVYGL